MKAILIAAATAACLGASLPAFAQSYGDQQVPVAGGQAYAPTGQSAYAAPQGYERAQPGYDQARPGRAYGSSAPEGGWTEPQPTHPARDVHDRDRDEAKVQRLEAKLEARGVPPDRALSLARRRIEQRLNRAPAQRFADSGDGYGR